MDNIQRKLALIDNQLSKIPTHEIIFATCPLLIIGLGLISGIIIQNIFCFPNKIWLVLLTTSFIAAIFLYIIKSNLNQSRYFSAYLAFICFICLGAIRLTNFTELKPNDIRHLVSDKPVLATIRGKILTKPYTNKYSDWKFSRFMPSDPSSSFYLEISEIETKSGWTEAKGKAQVFVDEIVLDLSQGDYIQAYCWVNPIIPPSNPGQFNTGDYLAKNGVFVGISIRSRSGIKIIHKPDKGTIAFIKIKIRELAKVALLGDLQDNDKNNGLLQALLLGYRGDIDSQTREAFRKTGLAHFISLSGLHMGIIIGIIWWFSKISGFMKPGRSIICIVAIILFLMVIPPKAPSLRASIIAIIFCLSFIFRRHPNSINTLSLSAIILLMIRPTQLFEAGWQLSFSSVLGIILFSRRIDFFLHEKFNNLISQKLSKSWHLFILILNNAITLFSAGLSAWFASAGILLYHFHTITPLASLWTVLVFPIVGLILISGFLKILLFFLLPTLSLILGVLVSYLSVLLIAIVKFLASLGISEILIGNVPLVFIIPFYCLLAAFILLSYYYPSFKKKLILPLILMLLIIPGAIKWQHSHNDNLVLTCLDVGHGQAIFLQTPEGQNLLFDAGSMYKSNVGERIIIPFLKYSGIRKIDTVLISHNDIDHINGIPEILRSCNIGNIYANNDFFDQKDEWGTATFLKGCVQESGYCIEHLDNQYIFNNQTKVKLLWPIKDSNYQEELSENDKSLVVSIDFANQNILLCSDIEQFAQDELLRLYPDLKADIVVVPHHGSTNTLEPGFLEKLNAEILICSTDKIPSISYPGKLYYTSRDGAICVVINKDGETETGTYKKSD